MGRRSALRRSLLLAVITVMAWGALGLPATAASAGLYRYIDEDGVVHFTSTPTDRRYRRMAITRDGLQFTRRRPADPPAYYGYDVLISRASAAYAMDPALVKAVIAAESKFNAHAISRKGAQGLMQLMPGTARGLGIDDPLSPDENVMGGVRYLREMYNRYGDLDRTLAAYNAGPTAVDHYGGVPPYKETRTYVKRVLQYYRRYHGDFHR